MQQFREPSQVKEFETVTNLKKIAIELITPIVKKIEAHVSVVLEEGERFRQDNARLKNVADFQEQLQLQMKQQASTIQQIREQLGRLRDVDDSLRASDEGIKVVSQMEIASLKVELAKKSTRIEELNNEKEQLKNVVTAIKHALRDEIQLIQDNFREVVQETQIKTNNFENKSQELERRLQQTEQLLKEETSKALESSQRLELYTQQRQDINQKMGYLYEHIFGHVSTDEFDKYKKYQTMEIKSAIQRMQQVVNAALTPEVRRFLPTVIDSVQQLKKLEKMELDQIRVEKILQERFSESLEALAAIEKKLIEQMQSAQSINQRDHLLITEKLAAESQQLMTDISSRLESNLKTDKIEKEQILEKVDVVKQDIETKIEVQTLTLNTKLENVVQEKKEQIFSAVRNLIPQQEVDFFNMMKSFVPKMEEIKSNVEARCQVIENLAVGLQDTLEKFSNRITKIKTDLDMRHDTLITDIRYLQKNREENVAKFEKVGLSMSIHTEMLTLLNTWAIHLEAYRRRANLNNQVFVSMFDGLVYELRPTIEEDIITYRKKPINKIELLRASLTCFLSYVDNTFSEDFMAWKTNKPSNLFKNAILEQLDHERLKQELSSNGSKPYVSISPLDVHAREQEDPSTMTINTERQSIGGVPPAFSRTTDGLKKIIMTNNKPKKDRYDNEMNTTTARIRSKNRGVSQL